MRRRTHVVAAAVVFAVSLMPLDAADAQSSSTVVNGPILFDSQREGQPEVFVVNPDGSGLRNLTNHQYDDRDATFSPDGSKILFSSNRRSSGNFDLYVMNADGSAVTRVLTAPSGVDYQEGDWSPAGDKIAYTRWGSGQGVYVSNANGTGTQLKVGTGSTPRWSPDGSKVAFESNGDVMVVGAAGGAVTNLTQDGAWDAMPSWSPDGQRVVFVSNRGWTYDIYVIAADGTAVTRLTETGEFEQHPTFSPDGREIAFTNSSGDIVRFDVQARTHRHVTGEGSLDNISDWRGVSGSPPPGQHPVCGLLASLGLPVPCPV